MMKNKAFTLVEITVTTGITIIVVALALLAFSRIRINVNEKAAINNVQTIANAIETYHISNNGCPELNNLATANPPYISEVFADNKHQGYIFSILPGKRPKNNNSKPAFPAFRTASNILMKTPRLPMLCH